MKKENQSMPKEKFMNFSFFIKPFLICLILILASSFVTNAFAEKRDSSVNFPSISEVGNESDDGEKDTVSPKNLFPDVKELAGAAAAITENRDRFLEKRGWEIGQSSANPGGALIEWGVAEIRRAPDDVEFGRARIGAFYRAFADAKGEFARYRQMDISTEMGREFFFDDLPEVSREIEQGDHLRTQISILAEKAIDLGEAHLNRLLRDVDIDPDKYRTLDREERNNIMRDSIARAITSKSLSSMAGLRILTTFEDVNSVGVLVIYNEQSEQIARQISRGESISRRSSDVITNTIRNQLSTSFPDDESYVYQHGVRVMEDESGEKVLVSFGQWSPKITRATSRLEREGRMRSARSMARSHAHGALTDFINSSLVLENAGQFKQTAELSQIMTSATIEEDESHQIGDRVEDIVNQYGSAILEGVTTVKSWSANHPNTGHIIVGHVAMWSPSTRDASRGEGLSSIDDSKKKEDSPKKMDYDNEVREGTALDHLDPTLR